MRPIVQTLNGPAATLQIPLDTYQNPFDVSVDVVVTGTITYGVQASNDNPWSGSAPVNLPAVPGLSALVPGTVISAQGALTTAYRQLYVTVTAGTGSIQVRVTQSGVMG